MLCASTYGIVAIELFPVAFAHPFAFTIAPHFPSEDAEHRPHGLLPHGDLR